MPIAMDPTATLWLELDHDKDRPEDARPKFEARFPTVRERLRMNKLIRAAAEERDDDKAADLLQQVITTALVGWRNVTDRAGELVAFDPAKLFDLLTVAETWDLAHMVLALTRVSALEKKVSGSRATSDAAPSAAAAGPPGSA